MANPIDAVAYETIADLYTTAVSPLADLASYYSDAADVILFYSDDHTSAQATNVEVDLLPPFNSAYLSAAGIYGTTTQVLPVAAVEAVRALQKHVLDRSGLSTLALYYTSVGINTANLSAEFKALSAAAGYTIV